MTKFLTRIRLNTNFDLCHFFKEMMLAHDLGDDEHENQRVDEQAV